MKEPAIHRECLDCGKEYKISKGLKDLALIASGVTEDQIETQCLHCDSENTEKMGPKPKLVKSPQLAMEDKIMEIGKLSSYYDSRNHKLVAYIFVWDKDKDVNGLLGYSKMFDEEESIEEVSGQQIYDELIVPLVEKLVDDGYTADDIMDYYSPRMQAVEEFGVEITRNDEE